MQPLLALIKHFRVQKPHGKMQPAKMTGLLNKFHLRPLPAFPLF
jgi:hypothetical protein